MKDYYRILQAHREADAETIKAIYRSLTRRLHPDKNPNNRDWAEKRMRELNEAYGVLSDKVKRADFDRRHPAPSGRAGSETNGQLRSALEENRALHNQIEKLTERLEKQDDHSRGLQQRLKDSDRHRQRLEKELAVERERAKRESAKRFRRASSSAAAKEETTIIERGAADKTDSARVVALPGGAGTMLFARIPAAAFDMGSELGNADERPVHLTNLDEYWIGVEPVTCRQFSAFVKTNPSWSKRALSTTRHPDYLKPFQGDNPPFGKERHPVTHVTWMAAAAFVEWAGLELPTEAQWECAARAGQKGEYGGGNEYLPPNSANYGGKQGGVVQTRSYPPNAYGVYGMQGNVWEWCADLYDDAFYAAPEASKRNPMRDGGSPSDAAARRVIRGGSWQSLSSDLRVAARGHMKAGTASMFCGFRCAFREKAG